MSSIKYLSLGLIPRSYHKHSFVSVLALFVLLLTMSITNHFFLTISAFANEHDSDDQVPKIVVLGDSLSAGYQLSQGDGFPEKLQVVLDAKSVPAKIINAGVSGDTTSGGLSRLAWSVPEGTDGVLLELGANDALRGLPVETTYKNLEMMIEQLQDRGIKVLLIGMLAPPNMGADYAKAFNNIYSELAQKYQLPLYPFFLDGVITVREHTLEDGMHPNTRGVEIMVGKILPLMEVFIENLRPIP